MPINSAGTRDEKSCKRPCRADVEQHALGGNRLPNSDERAERAREAGERRKRRHRDEERPRRVNLIISTGEIVAELVRAKNRQDRAAIPEPVEIKPPVCQRQWRSDRDAAEIRDEARVMKTADQRGGEDGNDEQQPVQPDAILEFLPGRKRNREQWFRFLG